MGIENLFWLFGRQWLEATGNVMSCKRLEKLGYVAFAHLVPVGPYEDLVSTGFNTHANLADIAETAPSVFFDGR